MNLLTKLKHHATKLKSEVFTLYFVARHPETPWYAKLFIAGVVFYALSPIDLIPDFIPILGYLDDLILLPLGIALALKMVPEPIVAQCRKRAQETILNEKPKKWKAVLVVVLVWLLVIFFLYTIIN